MALRLSDFDFDLPDDLIALRPQTPRGDARLLEVVGARLSDLRVSDLPSRLAPGDLLVFNDTRVIPARLDGLRRREGGEDVAVEATLIERESDDQWRAYARPGRRLRLGDVIDFRGCRAEIVDKGSDGGLSLRFDVAGAALDDAVRAIGKMPLPPYIARRRAPDTQDVDDYQPLLARREGAVAAPTASLHFDAALFEALSARGVSRTCVTLHVGAGTFAPIKTDDVSAHRMHSELGELTEEAAESIAAARAADRRVIAVGTTVLRLLESAVDADGIVRPWRGATDIFITPEHRCRSADALITNFHLPKSTLLLLVSAFAGVDAIRTAYDHAIRSRYRFFSYGDASLLHRRDGL